jgi:FKBP-type peptidyl-prolyl cis-trans isomerase FkpA
MNSRFVLLGALTAAVAVSCIDPLDVPPCTPTTVTPVSASGDTVTTNTGLKYVDGLAGQGVAADWCETLAVHYSAYLLDGTKFDSSAVNNPLLFTPGVGSIIDGLEQGVIGMRTEGSRRLIIPPGLAFGAEPRRNTAGEIVIPGNSTVVFDIEVLAVDVFP